MAKIDEYTVDRREILLEKITGCAVTTRHPTERAIDRLKAEYKEVRLILICLTFQIGFDKHLPIYVQVSPNSPDEFLLVDGNHRLVVFLSAGFTKWLAVVLKDDTPKVVSLTYSSNVNQSVLYSISNGLNERNVCGHTLQSFFQRLTTIRNCL